MMYEFKSDEYTQSQRNNENKQEVFPAILFEKQFSGLVWIESDEWEMGERKWIEGEGQVHATSELVGVTTSINLNAILYKCIDENCDICDFDRLTITDEGAPCT